MKASILHGKIGRVYRCRMVVERCDCIRLFPEWILGSRDAFHALTEEHRESVYMQGVDAQVAWGKDIPLVIDVEVKGVSHSALFRHHITMAEREEIIYDATAVCLTPIPCEFSISGRVVEQRKKSWCDTFYWRDPMMKSWEFPRHDKDGKLLPFPLLFLRCRQGDMESFCGPYHYTSFSDYVCMRPFTSGHNIAYMPKCTNEESVKQAGLYVLGKADNEPQDVSYIAVKNRCQVLDEENRDIIMRLIHSGDAEALKKLLTFFPNIDLNVQDDHGLTLIMLACLASSWDIMRCLLEKQINVYLRDSEGRTLIDIVQQMPQNEEPVAILRDFGIQVPIIINKDWGEAPIEIPPHPRGHIQGQPYREHRIYRNGEHIVLRCYDSLAEYRFTTNPPDGYNLNTSETERMFEGRKLGRCACDIPKWKLDGFNLNNPNAYWFVDTKIDGTRRTWKCRINDIVRYAQAALRISNDNGEAKYKLFFDFKRGLAYTTPVIGMELAIPFEREETN